MCGNCNGATSDVCNTCNADTRVFSSYRDRLEIPAYTQSQDALRETIMQGGNGELEKKGPSKLWWLSLLLPFGF